MSELEELLDYVSSGKRTAPGGIYWTEFFRILVGPIDNFSGIKEPPIPLILTGAWYSSDEEKRAHLRKQIEFGLEKGLLKEMAEYLYSLREDDWYHEGDFG